MRLPLLPRKEVQVFKNVSFDTRAIAYFVMTRNTRFFTVFIILEFFGESYLSSRTKKYN